MAQCTVKVSANGLMGKCMLDGMKVGRSRERVGSLTLMETSTLEAGPMGSNQGKDLWFIKTAPLSLESGEKESWWPKLQSVVYECMKLDRVDVRSTDVKCNSLCKQGIE